MSNFSNAYALRNLSAPGLLASCLLPQHQTPFGPSAELNPCFQKTYSAQCIAFIALKRGVSEARARTLIGQALNLYAAKDQNSPDSIYKPSAVAVACLASPRTLRPAPDSDDCAACGPACTQETTVEVCELYCASKKTLETSTFYTTSGGMSYHGNGLLMVRLVAFVIIAFIIISIIVVVVWQCCQTHREMNGHATGTNARPLPKRPNLSLNDGHSEEVYEEPFSVPLARQQSDTSRSSALIPAKNQQSLIPGHTAESICDTTFQNHDRLRSNVEAEGAGVRQATRTANDATNTPLLPISLSSPQSPQERSTIQ